MNYKIILLLPLFLLTLFNCQEKSNSTEIHPISSRYPYYHYNEKVKSLKKDTVLNLKYSDRIKLTKRVTVDSVAVNGDDLKVVSVDKKNLLFLDKSYNRLLLYSILKNEWVELATQGRGPMDILYASDMVFNNGKLFISTLDGRIKEFKCNTDGCIFIEEKRVNKFHPVSISMFGDKTYLMGISSEFTKPFEGTVISSIHELDNEFNLGEHFGEIYDIENEWMLLRPFIDGGIRNLNDNLIIQYFDLIPEIYLIDNKEINQKYTNKNYKLTKRSYRPDIKELLVDFTDWSSIHDVVVKDEIIIIIIKNLYDRNIESGLVDWKFYKDVYIIDKINFNERYLFSGRVNSNVYVTKHHILVMDENFNINIYEYEI